MRKIAVLPVLLFHLSALSSPAQSNEPWKEIREGSKEERQLIEHLEAKLDALSIPHRRFDFSESQTMHSFGTCLEAVVAGTRSDSLILSVPLNWGETNMELAITLLEQALSKVEDITLKVLFLSAEFGDHEDSQLGSRLYLEQFPLSHPAAVLYLQMRKIPQRIIVRTVGGRTITPGWLVKRTACSLKEARIPFLLRGIENPLQQIGLSERSGAIAPYLEAGIPAVAFDGEYGEDEGHEWVRNFSRFFWLLYDSCRDGMPEDWDRNYIYAQWGQTFLFIPEEITVVTTVAVVAVVLLLILLYPSILRITQIWRSLLILICGILALLASSGLVHAILVWEKYPEAWTVSPFAYLSFKLAAASLIFTLAYPLVPRSRSSRSDSESPYPSVALLCLLATVLILSGINLSLALCPLWALFWALFFVFVRNRIARIPLLILSSLCLLGVTYLIFSLPALPFVRETLLSGLWGNAVMALLLFPFLLLVFELVRLFSSAGKRRTNRRAYDWAFHWWMVGFLGLGAVSLLVTLIWLPSFGPEKLQHVQATWGVDMSSGESSLTFQSNAPLGKIHYFGSGRWDTFETSSRDYIVSTEPPDNLFTARTEMERVLDRKNVTIHLESVATPYRIELSLLSSAAFDLFHSSFPSVDLTGDEISGGRHRGGNLNDGRRGFSFIIGRYPPQPFSILLTLPEGMVYTLAIKLEYREPPFPLLTYGKDKEIQNRFVFTEELSFET